MKILIAAGGTGGHIYPGLAIAERIKKEDDKAEIIFIGSQVGMEKNIIPQAGYAIEYIRVRGFEKEFSFETLAAVKGVFDGLRDAKKVLKKHQPDLVIGTGGFTAGPLLLKASQRGIPTLVHEQNAFPGKTNRILGKKVDRVAISFKEAADFFPHNKTVLCGNPVRQEYIHPERQVLRKKLGLKDNDRMILIMGGSQGAGSINQAALELMDAKKEQPDLYIHHLTGKGQFEKIRTEAEIREITKNKKMVIEAYNTELYNLLGASDLVVSRSGAMSVAEIAAVGVPSILVPYPMAAGNHQEFNARVVTDPGGGILIHDNDLTGNWLIQKVNELLEQPEQLENMRKETLKKGILDAGDRIYAELKKLMEKT